MIEPGHVVADIDIYRAALAVLDRYGEDPVAAELHCAFRVDELLGSGDLEGMREWYRVRTAVVELTRGRKADEAVN